MSKLRDLLAGTTLALALAVPAQADRLGLGRVALPEEIAAWDMTVLPDGQGLRPGSGSVEVGEEVFAEACASCHGDFGEGIDSWPVLAGGVGSLTDPRPVKTVGSYWPYASTVWDYVHRSMPFGSAQTLTTDDVYAITAYILYSNGLIEDDFVLSDQNFTEIVLPNVDGFYADDRAAVEYPLFAAAPCMSECRAPVQITRRATDLAVTPMDENGKPAGTLPVIEVTSAVTEPAKAPAAEPEVIEVVATVDPELIKAGEAAFRKCSACHKVGEGARNGVGPTLNGIVGMAAGTIEGFKYSKPLMDAAAAGLVWTPEELSAFLENPKSYMRGTKMAFNGLKSEDERRAVIAYLQGLSQ